MAGKHYTSPQPVEWVKGNAVGSGSFGVVNLAMNKSNGELFVVKSSSSAAGFQSLENEANILKNLDSPHVVQCLGHDVTEEAEGKRKFNLFMEFMAGGSLSDIVKRFGGALDESVIRSYTCDILHGLAYLHRNGIVHCDLKCKNVLLGSSGNIKLADFGAAKRLNSSTANADSKNFWQSMCGTPLWMAPEVLRNEGLDFASDIWSLGCTIIEMATGRTPWGDDVSNPLAAVYKIACSNETPQLPSNFSPEGLDFLRKCLQRNPRFRWSSSDLLSHPFVSGKPAAWFSGKEDADSPTSVLDERGWEPDGSDSPGMEDLLARMPFSKRFAQRERGVTKEMDGEAAEWIVVR